MSEAHPLFPVEDDDDEPAEVGWIHVTRNEGGRVQWARKLYAAKELTSLDQLYELYGGGYYELIARSDDKKRITARITYPLEGRPRPLNSDAAEAPAAPVAAPVAAMPSVDPNVQLILGMMQQSTAQTTALITAMGQQTAATMQAIVAMAGNKGDGGGAAAVMQAALDNNTKLLTSVLSRAEPEGAADALVQGMELATTFMQNAQQNVTPQKDDTEILIEGMKAFAELKKSGEAPAS